VPIVGVKQDEVATIARRVVKVSNGARGGKPALNGPIAPGPPDEEYPFGSAVVGNIGQDGGGDVPGGRSRRRKRQGDKERGGHGDVETGEGAIVEGTDLPGSQGSGAGKRG